jgi:hypothetical protein
LTVSCGAAWTVADGLAAGDGLATGDGLAAGDWLRADGLVAGALLAAQPATKISAAKAASGPVPSLVIGSQLAVRGISR